MFFHFFFVVNCFRFGYTGSGHDEKKDDREMSEYIHAGTYGISNDAFKYLKERCNVDVYKGKEFNTIILQDYGVFNEIKKCMDHISQHTAIDSKHSMLKFIPWEGEKNLSEVYNALGALFEKSSIKPRIVYFGIDKDKSESVPRFSICALQQNVNLALLKVGSVENNGKEARVELKDNGLQEYVARMGRTNAGMFVMVRGLGLFFAVS